MRTTMYYPGKTVNTILIVLALLLMPTLTTAQDDEDPGISLYQYRYVPQDKMAEFIARETKYWSKVAENAIAKGNLTFWGIFQKVGGFDIPNSPNVLFINTFKDIDNANMAEIWDPSSVWPNVPMDQMETNSMSKVHHMLFVRPAVWVEANNAVPEKDLNYVKMIYHNASSPGDLIALENEHWTPFIQSSMDSGKTKQKAWGNAMILSPTGPDMKANTISYDIYATLQEALNPTWDPNTVFPMDGLTKIGELEMDQRISYVYRIVKVVTPPGQ